MEKIENVQGMKKVDLDDMFRRSFWKDILYEIISTMDPWDIEIAELATRYAEKVEQMKEMNFRIPANVLIVSSVLLRMKSQLMGFTEIDYDPNGEECIGNSVDSEPAMGGLDFVLDSDTKAQGGNGDKLLNLVVRPKRVPKRRLTALELISAIQEVLEDRVIRKKIKEKNTEELIIPLNRDIKQLIEETYRRVMEILSSKDVVLFSEIAHGRDEVISTFISLLHLSNTQRLKLKQERIFDEIYIHL